MDSLTQKEKWDDCIDDMKGWYMLMDEYEHMNKLWKTYDIKL